MDDYNDPSRTLEDAEQLSDILSALIEAAKGDNQEAYKILIDFCIAMRPSLNVFKMIAAMGLDPFNPNAGA